MNSDRSRTGRKHHPDEARDEALGNDEIRIGVDRRASAVPSLFSVWG